MEDQPFASLSTLPDSEAISIMRDFYKQRGDSVLDGRFRDPELYLGYRRRTENWLYEEFKSKGGKPSNIFPAYLTLGQSQWLIDNLDGDYFEIRVSLESLDEAEISFTFPDSMTSWGLGIQKTKGLYDPELHGKVFNYLEVMEIINKKHERFDEGSSFHLENAVTQFFEAQVWNVETFVESLEHNKSLQRTALERSR
jgi:hypothetical protein